MKKLISLILALILVFSMLTMVSCEKKEDEDDDKTAETLAGMTPEELYAESQQKLKDANSFVADSSQVITMTYGGETITMNQTVKSKVSGDNSYAKTYNDFDSSANMECWYVDGMVYASMAGVKAKAEISKEEYMQQYMNADPSESTLLDIPESWFEDIKFEKKGESWVLNFVVSGEKYTALLENTGLGGEIVGDVKYQIYFDDEGNLEKVLTKFDMKIQGVDAHCDSTSIISIEDVTITPPADADSYQLTELN